MAEQRNTMADYNVPRGATVKLGHIDGDLRVGRNATIEAGEGNLVSVSGAALFDGSAEIDCSFECDSLRVRTGGVLKVQGDLIVLNLLDADHSIEVSGTLRAGEIDVGGRIEARSLNCTKMRVGGKVEVAGKLEVESLTVGGKVEAPGEVLIRDFDVGGQAELGSGKISGNIRVGGKFEVQSKLEFGEMRVLGRTDLGAGSKGTRISANGKLSAAGDFECDDIAILGKAEVQGNCKSKKIKVNGMLDVHGSLQNTELVEINGTVEVDQNLEATDVRLGGKLEAKKILATNQADIAGMVETDQGLKAKTVNVSSGSRVEGPIVAEVVDLGKSYAVILNQERQWMGQVATMRLVGRMTNVDDIYADTVHLGKASKSRRVYARVVELEEGCTVEEIRYTGELRGNLDRSYIHRLATKVDRLPEPPI